MCFFVGTTAHVGIKLYGKLGKSEARHLTKASAFQRNSRDDFLIATDKELGSLHKVSGVLLDLASTFFLQQFMRSNYSIYVSWLEVHIVQLI